jgi:nucleoside-diphosphate-sugar epimerase
VKTALVTGHLGFVGSHIWDRLHEEGWALVGSDIKNNGDDCRNIFATHAKFDLVVHCAAIVGGREKIEGQPMEIASDLAIDSDFFQYVLRTRPGKAIYFSSSAAYPIALQGPGKAMGSMMTSQPHRLREDDIDGAWTSEPDAIYGWVKLTGEKMARQANRLGANIQVFRPFSGYGPDQDLTYPFPAFLDRAIKFADPFEIWGNGTQVRDWIHIDDIVDCVMNSLDWFEPMEPINLGTGLGHSMIQVVDMMTAAVGYEPEIRFRPEKPVGVMYRVADVQKMSRAVGLPKISLREGIERALREDDHVRSW